MDVGNARGGWIREAYFHHDEACSESQYRWQRERVSLPPIPADRNAMLNRKTITRRA